MINQGIFYTVLIRKKILLIINMEFPTAPCLALYCYDDPIIHSVCKVISRIGSTSAIAKKAYLKPKDETRSLKRYVRRAKYTHVCNKRWRTLFSRVPWILIKCLKTFSVVMLVY